MAEKVEPDIFKPPHHKLKHNIETKLTELLQEYNSQFAQDETSIGSHSWQKWQLKQEPLNQYLKNNTL